MFLRFQLPIRMIWDAAEGNFQPQLTKSLILVKGIFPTDWLLDKDSKLEYTIFISIKYWFYLLYAWECCPGTTYGYTENIANGTP